MAVFAIWMTTLLATVEAQSLRKIAFSDEPTGFGDTEFGFIDRPPLINNSGDIEFASRITNVSPQDNMGLWIRSRDGNLSLVAQSGASNPDLEPDESLGFFFNATNIALNNAGQFTIFAGIRGSFINDSARWLGSKGGIGLIVRELEPAPGVSGAFFNNFPTQKAMLNDSGETVFLSNLTGDVIEPSDSLSLWKSGTDGLELLIREGQQAPGTEPEVFVNNIDVEFSFYFSALNNMGDTSMTVDLTGDTVNNDNDGAVYRKRSGGQLELVAREGDLVPALGDDAFISSLTAQTALTPTGELVFESAVNGGEFNLTPVIFRENNDGTLSPVVIAGDPAPGTDEEFSNFFDNTSLGRPLVNDNGHILFFGRSGPFLGGRNGLWKVAPNSSPELIALQGEQAPGMSSGTVFLSFFDIVLNSAGQVAFRARVEGPGVTAANDFGIWVQDANGQFTLVVREGDTINVSNDPNVEDLREVETLSFHGSTGNNDGFSSGFNDFGEVAFHVLFLTPNAPNVQGVFTSDVAAFTPGDVNGDGSINLFDVAPFVDAISNGSFAPAADINGDGFANLLDIAPFVALLTGG